MLLHLKRAILISIVLIVVCGLAYPAILTGIGQGIFNNQANGSLVSENGKVIGSNLIGQPWTGPGWFQGRPDPYTPLASGGANLGPRSAALVKAAHSDVVQLEKEGITPTNDLVTTSFSGMDPDISPQDAYAQVDAVAKARGLPVSVVHALVVHWSYSAELGFLGDPYIDVLQLNEALAKLH